MGIWRLVPFALFVAAPLACSASTPEPARSTCEDEPIERLKELIVVDDAVIEDARAHNGTAGPWSFRHVVENLTPEGRDPGELVRRWLDQWVTVKELNGSPVDRPSEQRDGEMKRLILCPWLRRTPANTCNEDCSICTGYGLDLAHAPFRLAAIVNRIDLRDEVAEAPSGEGRFVFGLTDGPADDPASRPLPMTVVVEYTLPSSRTPQAWAEAWHELGKLGAFDETYRAALEQVTRSFTTRGSNPDGINGSALGQIRTNESALNWIWQLREFGLSSDGNLRLRPIRNTPVEALNNTPALREHVLSNREAILAKKYEMPLLMRAGAADQLLYTWNVPGVDEPLRRAFASGTCNGCHSTENPNVDTAFHVSPYRRGVAKLSPFLYSTNGRPDELSARAKIVQRTLCGG